METRQGEGGASRHRHWQRGVRHDPLIAFEMVPCFAWKCPFELQCGPWGPMDYLLLTLYYKLHFRIRTLYVETYKFLSTNGIPLELLTIINRLQNHGRVEHYGCHTMSRTCCCGRLSQQLIGIVCCPQSSQKIWPLSWSLATLYSTIWWPNL